MKQPRPRVVGLEGDDEKPARWEQRNVPTRWIVELECDVMELCGVVPLSKESKVVAVEVHLRIRSENSGIADLVGVPQNGLTGCATRMKVRFFDLLTLGTLAGAVITR